MSSLISSVAWVKRGVATQHPSKYVLDERELERVSKLARIELEDAKTELKRAQEAAAGMGRGAEGEEADDVDEDEEGKAAVDGDGNDEDAWVDEDDAPADAMEEDDVPVVEEEDDMSKYKLEDYDEDAGATGTFSNIKGLQFYQNNDEDPYITLKENDEENEREELEVLPSDNMIVVAKTEDELPQLDIYLYNEVSEDLYVHHDLMLPNFPLCIEWLDFGPSSTSAGGDSTTQLPGNFVAVGTLDPEIEIWSLDVVDPMYPDMMLGRPDLSKAHVPTPLGTGKKKKKKSKRRELAAGWHVDAVLSLSWNRTHRNLLASASADHTVKLWDLNHCATPARKSDADGDEDMGEGGARTGPRAVIGGDENAGMAIRSFDKLHKDKVQSVEWNQKEPTVILTGSYDRTVRMVDTRAPDAGVGAVVGADVEALRWDPWEAHNFYVSLENGMVVGFDARSLPSSTEFASSPCPSRFTLQAHDGAVSALDLNPHIRGCMVTGGTDKMVKVWNLEEATGGGSVKNVTLVTSRDLGVGKVFAASFSSDDPLTVAAAGSKAKLQIWDVGANVGARKAFGPKLAAAGRELREKTGGGVIGLHDDDEGSERGEDDE